jgi:hypothetical protein
MIHTRCTDPYCCHCKAGSLSFPQIVDPLADTEASSAVPPRRVGMHPALGMGYGAEPGGVVPVDCAVEWTAADVALLEAAVALRQRHGKALRRLHHFVGLLVNLEGQR